MFNIPGKYKNKNFCLDDPEEREECERILSEHGPFGRVLKYTDMHTKEGRLFVAMLWVEPITQKDYRD